ncbi:hypothetical protein [Enterococcus sp. AZ177]|uniref:hypothetical protein n=1 Tax=unclassified Enterococcus TaxID=2608891 RepID=UPI003D2FEB64
MIKNTSKLEKHLKSHPTDAQSIISLLKIRSANYQYSFDLEAKKKREMMNSIGNR